jgi:integrase/recombinase XerD
MARHRNRPKLAAAPSAPLTPIEALAEQYFTSLLTQNFSADTVLTRRATLGYFFEWAKERGLNDPIDITRTVLERYQRALFQYRKRNGQPLSFRTQAVRLLGIKGFFRWLARQNHILHNPASELLLPRPDSRLPKYVLTAREAEQVLQQPDAGDPEGLRDRAMLETFYATGMRRMELANLKLYDIDADRGTVRICQGKGKKDRYVPIGERALKWIGKYVNEARPALAPFVDDSTVFLNHLGAAFERKELTRLVHRYLKKSNIGKVGGCHLFRHTVATLMLENGADVRVIQELLGHAKLSTTELYTRVSINLLKQVYAATHPAAKLFEDLDRERIEEDGE